MAHINKCIVIAACVAMLQSLFIISLGARLELAVVAIRSSQVYPPQFSVSPHVSTSMIPLHTAAEMRLADISQVRLAVSHGMLEIRVNRFPWIVRGKGVTPLVGPVERFWAFRFEDDHGNAVWRIPLIWVIVTVLVVFPFGVCR